MLTMLGAGQRMCDGVNRRQFLTIGGLAMGGITLPQLLAGGSGGRDASGTSRSS